MSGLQKYRFYHDSLKDIYNACLIPTSNRFEALNTSDENQFSVETVRKSNCTNSTHRAPASFSYPNGGAHFLSSVFNGFDPSKPRSFHANKRRRLSVSTQVSRPPLSEPKRKQTNGQKRKANLEGHFRMYRIRMLPTAEQKKELNRCFRVARYAYNWANECVREGFAPPNHRELRTKWRANKIMDSLDYANADETRVSSNIASRAIQELTDAYASNFAKRRKNPEHTFSVKFRSYKKTPVEIIHIDKDIAGPNNEYTKKTSTLLRFDKPETFTKGLRRGMDECLIHMGNNLRKSGGIRLQDKVHVISKLLLMKDRLHEDAMIRWDKRTDRYYFHFLYVIPKLDDPDPEFMCKRIVATDPGCSPFQQWYSPTSGNYGQLLHGARPTLKAKCLALDHLQSRIARRRNAPNQWKRPESGKSEKRRFKRRRTARTLKRKFARDRARLKGWIAAAHYDAANFLLENHDVIIQPILQVRRLTAKTSRLFGNDMARNMYTWSHYLFRQRLKSAAARYQGRHVFETTEPGTSKTCTHCGFWKADLKLCDKRFDCPSCGIQVDRQIAGARNNFLAAYGMAIGLV